LATEGVKLSFTEDALAEMAGMAEKLNQASQSTGARRLYTILERVVEELSFEASERSGETISIDAAFVRDRLSDIAADEDLSRFIL
jgi:ATP-dependent HslUV protease ATP-binding subunit HslU